jgi:hypothetical protein
VVNFFFCCRFFYTRSLFFPHDQDGRLHRVMEFQRIQSHPSVVILLVRLCAGWAFSRSFFQKASTRFDPLRRACRKSLRQADVEDSYLHSRCLRGLGVSLGWLG